MVLWSINIPIQIDSAVIPTPDPLAGELPRAFVKLREGQVQEHNLAIDIFKFVDDKVAPHKKLRGTWIILFCKFWSFIDHVGGTHSLESRWNLLCR